MLASHNILSPASGQPITVPTQDLVLGLYYLTKAKVNAKGEGRVFANIEEVLMALEAKQVETLTPIRLRYTGPVLDMTTAYDDQDLNHTEPVEFNKQFISTTVGRAILNDALPEGMPYVNGLLKKKGIGQLVNYCYLNLGLEVTVKTLDRSRTSASLRHQVRPLGRPRRHGHPRLQVHRRGEAEKRSRHAAAVSRRRHHQRRALQQGHPDVVGRHRARRR
jgi:DNA-directed RNA polymerase beta' subunit